MTASLGSLCSLHDIERTRNFFPSLTLQPSRRSPLASSLVCPSSLSVAVRHFGSRAATRKTRPDGSNLTPAQIDSTVNGLIQAAHVTGAGVVLFHRTKVVYLKAYGLREVESNLPLTPDSVTTAPSLTKSAFATVVMRLVQRGTLDLGKPLGDFTAYADLKGVVFRLFGVNVSALFGLSEGLRDTCLNSTPSPRKSRLK